MKATIVLLPGDGIGGEVVTEGRAVLDEIAARFGHDFAFEEQLIGGIAIDRTGAPLPESTLAACRASSAILLGAVGGPKWDDPAAKVRPEQGLLGLRRELDLYGNLRPVLAYPQLAAASPVIGRELRELDLPEGSTIAVLIRDERAHSPRSDTKLRSGDKLLAVTSADSEAELRSLLIGE
jgi:3-isopropylmalate dehydrogenase